MNSKDDIVKFIDEVSHAKDIGKKENKLKKQKH